MYFYTHNYVLDLDTDAVDVDSEDPSREKDDNKKKKGDGRREDEQANDDDNSSDSISDTQLDNDSDINIAKPEFEKRVSADDNNSNNFALDTQPYVDNGIDLAKSEEIEKKVTVIAKSGLGNIVDLKLTGGLVVNCLVDTTLALRNPLPNTFDKDIIILENILVNVIANLFDTISSVNSSGTFIVPSGSLIENGSLANSMVAKSFNHATIVPLGSTTEADVIVNPFVTFISSSMESGRVANLRAANPIVDTHGNFIFASTSVVCFGPIIGASIVSNLSADILFFIKPSLFFLAPNTTYEK